MTVAPPHPARRAARVPEVSIFRDLGHDIVPESACGIAAPRGTTPAMVTILHDALKLAVHDPQHLAVLARFDMRGATSTARPARRMRGW
jgi:tripartite-type tricarboxylate transporter receptor subunit TctC